MPLYGSIRDAQYFVQVYRKILLEKELKLPISLTAPFVWDSARGFTDFYSREAIPAGMWIPGQPNGNESQPFTSQETDTEDGRLYDVYNMHPVGRRCQCKFSERPILRLRGLCKDSYIDSHFTIIIQDRRAVFKSVRNSEIQFSKSLKIPTWILRVNLKQTTAIANTEETSFVLGKQSWLISNDSVRCNMGMPYRRELKMSGCSNAEFTCSNGDCVSMAQRCDQLPHCEDESDEGGCRIVTIRAGYNKEVPPITSVSPDNKKVVPVPVKLSMRLFKVVDIDEEDYSIKLQFEIILEWHDNRLAFQNLKEKTSLNALTENETRQLWLPLVIYANTDQKESTRLGGFWEWSTSMLIIKEGAFTRSGMEEIDEVEVYRGDENTLRMQQTYTHNFQCVYQLVKYPFDTQVSKFSFCNYFIHSFCFLLLQIQGALKQEFGICHAL